MKIYTIAKTTHECYGHGDFGTESRIVRMGPYGGGDFPPAFKTREQAEQWVRDNERDLPTEKTIVEMDLIEQP